jgi:rod shape-determining protein MreC
MARGLERWQSRRDTWAFAICMFLSVFCLFIPRSWGTSIASALRTTALWPMVWLQERAAEGRTSRARFRAVTAQRDSLAQLGRGVGTLLEENQELRRLLGLGERLGPGFVSAEVLHQPLPTDGRTLLLDAGRMDGVEALSPVVSPDGLIGVIRDVDENTSIAMTWAHPEFRVSGVSESGVVAGIVGPTAAGDASRTSLEFRAITYRDTLPEGSLVVASGLGGVYPQGVPIGAVVGVEREQTGWERVYRLRPLASPSMVAHVLILKPNVPFRVPGAFILPDTARVDSTPGAGEAVGAAGAATDSGQVGP